MLNNVKNMILKKQDYMEAAAIIFEDTAGTNVDNLIVLNEKAEHDKEPDPNLDNEDTEKNDGSQEDSHEEEPKGKDDDPDGEDDITNIPLDGEENSEGDDDPEDQNPPSEDILNSKIGDEDTPLTVDSDLPAVEPGKEGLGDLLNVTIDLGSNTLTDILPVPPDNAGEAIAGDVLETRVDSGFSEDASTVPTPANPTVTPAPTSSGTPTPPAPATTTTTNSGSSTPTPPSDPSNPTGAAMDNESVNNDTDDEDLLSTHIEEKVEGDPDGKIPEKCKECKFLCKCIKTKDGHKIVPVDVKDCKHFEKCDTNKVCKESTDSFLEAITLDGSGEDKPEDGKEPAPVPKDDAGSTDDQGAAPTDGTAADGAEEVPEEGEENAVTSAVKSKVAEAEEPVEGGGGNPTSGKEALLKKLGSLTKGLEDAKKAVMDTIQ